LAGALCCGWWWANQRFFFSNNPVFHAKLGLVIVLLAVAIYPAWFLCRRQWQNPIPPTVHRLQKSALPLLVIIPVLAYLMARGVGY
jgi:putative membrane protein